MIASEITLDGLRALLCWAGLGEQVTVWIRGMIKRREEPKSLVAITSGEDGLVDWELGRESGICLEMAKDCLGPNAVLGLEKEW